MTKVRLSDQEIDAIKRAAKEIFGADIKVYLFGSRTDLNRKGGDIDLLIITNKEISHRDKIKFLVKVEDYGVERKVDLIIKTPNTKEKNIIKTAIETGMLI